MYFNMSFKTNGVYYTPRDYVAPGGQVSKATITNFVL